MTGEPAAAPGEDLAVESGWTPATIAERAFRGAFLLGARQAIVQGLNVLGAAILAHILVPAEFGYFAIFTFILSFLTIFGGIGLGASLVRDTEEPDDHDFAVVFTIQHAFVLAIGAALWFAAPAIARGYSLDPGSLWLFRLVAIALLFTSLQVIPVVRMERELAFGRIAVIETAQALTFNIVAVVLAWTGVGALSFALALLARAVVGAVMANVASPWAWHIAWDWPTARRHLSFSAAFQGSMILSIVKDSISPVLVGILIGATQVGYLRWAELVAVYPVLLLMVMQRVYLPAFGRMRAFPDRLARFVENVLLGANAIVAPAAVLTLVLIEPLTRIVFGAKWVPAIPVFILLWAANLFVPSATPIIGLLNAFGRSRFTFLVVAGITATTWAVGVPLILNYGIIGFGIATLVVQCFCVPLFRMAQRDVAFRIFPVIARPWALAAAMGALVRGTTLLHAPANIYELAAYFLVPLAAYAVAMIRLYPDETARAWALFRHPEPEGVAAA